MCSYHFVEHGLRSIGRHCAALICLGLAGLAGQVQAQQAEVPDNTPSVQTQLMQDLYTLAAPEMAGRATDTAGSRQAAAWIIRRLEQLRLRPCGADFIQDFRFTLRGQDKQGRNILACHAGSAPDHASRPMLLLSAHYDHLGVHNGKVHPGADDNASGVAALLAIAAGLQTQPLQHDVVLAFFDAEELGLQGAKALVARPVLDLQRVALNINLDMVGRGDRGELYASGSYHTPALRELMLSLPASPDLRLKLGHDRPEQGQDDWTTQSDHYPLFRAGIPFLYFGVEDHADYHQPGDTPDKIQPAFYQAAVNLIAQALRAADQRILHGGLQGR
ncbi:M20/M25/M40 family metallo-hydrolase [Undibacterium rugosum]|uniref:M20/M25/M40 family metallo-hydrolase n=1 Tax=Undibacterium rugosum TaxID=2762291 RepID=A0A923KYP9_9BURK|nr:M20/M25/M40 family metallo-hydrolase [Undibacterium rugosum]MBC3934775.1 M20/M25/M40 family metallo-hydrolase [Undibacterium rugosum]MBR7778375.1 M20/M25/M40 family metallo-hydrolase [Undibacterium rugosum]